jgi:hypothetical protein
VTWLHWLCHPLGFPFFEPPQNPPIMSSQQKSDYNQLELQEQFSVDAKNS